jgi:hypothetical protein
VAMRPEVLTRFGFALGMLDVAPTRAGCRGHGFSLPELAGSPSAGPAPKDRTAANRHCLGVGVNQ